MSRNCNISSERAWQIPDSKRPILWRMTAGRYIRDAIFAISSHDASREPVYRTPNYERNHSEEGAAQKDAREPDGNVRHPRPGRLRDPSPQGPGRL